MNCEATKDGMMHTVTIARNRLAGRQ